MMKKSYAILLIVLLVFAIKVSSRPASSLELVRTIPMPGITGRFDSFGIDLKGRRLFVTPLDHKTVEVYDLNTGKLIHSIPGIAKAHAVLYREDLNEIFVTDGPDGSVKIFRGDNYELVKAVRPLLEPDGILYDPATRYLYVITGGENAKLDYSLISVVDTDKGEHLADIRIEGGTMEEMRLEKSSSRLFVVNREKNRIEVLDRQKRTVLTSWPLTLGTLPVGLAMDESNHRLFVGCRSEVMVVLDSTSGKEITSFPLTKGIDGMVFDPPTKRIYSEANTGAIDVFEEIDPDHYRSLGTTPIGSPAKPGLLVPELSRYFVAVPQHGNVDTAILEYKVQ
jgi:DNA-binding beta-propeller fold protein YncE